MMIKFLCSNWIFFQELNEIIFFIREDITLRQILKKKTEQTCNASKWSWHISEKEGRYKSAASSGDESKDKGEKKKKKKKGLLYLNWLPEIILYSCFRDPNIPLSDALWLPGSTPWK